MIGPASTGRYVDPFREVRAHGREDGVEPAFLALRDQILDAVVARHADAHRLDAVDLRGHHVAGQAVGRDPVAHHPACQLAGVANLDLVAEPCEVVGGGEPARPGADHQHTTAAANRWRVERPAALEGEVAEKALDGVDRDRAVEGGAVADALTRVVTDASVNRGERVVRDELPPRLLVLSVLRVRQPGLDVLARRAAGVARRQEVDVERPALSNRPGLRTPVQEVGKARNILQRSPGPRDHLAQANARAAGTRAFGARLRRGRVTVVRRARRVGDGRCVGAGHEVRRHRAGTVGDRLEHRSSARASLVQVRADAPLGAGGCEPMANAAVLHEEHLGRARRRVAAACRRGAGASAPRGPAPRQRPPPQAPTCAVGTNDRSPSTRTGPGATEEEGCLSYATARLRPR